MRQFRGWVKERSFVALLIAALLAACNRHSTDKTAYMRNLAASVPTPSSTPRCWIYDKIHPVTKVAFESQHVTLTERKEIEKYAAPASPAQQHLVETHSPWAAPPSASEQHLVRWMRSPFKSGGIFVFVARPVEIYHNGYSPWVALNTNVTIDTVQCSVNAYPTA